MSVQGTNISAIGYTPNFSVNHAASARPVDLPEPQLSKAEAKPIPAPSANLLQQAVDDANNMFRQIHSDVQFVLDKDSNKVVVKLVEQGTGQVLNQYPTDQALAISQAIAQIQQQTAEKHAAFKANNSALQGLLFKQRS